MKRKITAIVLASLMTLGMAIQGFAADADFKPLTTTLYSGDMTSTTADELSMYGYGRDNRNTNANYSTGKSWRADWPLFGPNNDSVSKAEYKYVEQTTEGFEFKAMQANASINPAKRVMLNKTQMSKSDMVMSVGLKTGQFGTYTVDGTAVGMQLWFVFNDSKNIQPFSYKAATGRIEFAGTNSNNWSGMDSTKYFQLEENTEYTVVTEFLYNKENKNYDMRYTLKGADGAQIGQPIKIDGYTGVNGALSDITAINDNMVLFAYAPQTTADSDAKEGRQTYLTVKSIKLENQIKEHIIEFGDVEYTGGGTSLDEAMGDINLNALSGMGIESKSTSEYLAGNAWGTSYNTAAKNFITKDGWLYSNWAVGDTTWRSNLSKQFNGINDGDTLMFSSLVKMYKASLKGNKGADIQIRLSNDTRGNSDSYYAASEYLTLLDYNARPYSGFLVNIGGINQGTSIYSNKTYAAGTGIDWNLTKFLNQTETGTLVLKLEASLYPSKTADMYDAKITIRNNDDNTELLSATIEGKISKAAAMSYNQFEIESGTEVREDGAETPFGIKDVKIETVSGEEKSALTVGENSVYIPYTNITKNPFDIAAVVAVYDAEENQVDFAIGKYEDITAASGKIKIDGITITDTAKETAKVFLFDKFTTIVPYAEPVPIAVGE